MNKKLIIPAALGTAFIAGMAVVPNSVNAVAAAASEEPNCNELTSKNTGEDLKKCLTGDYSATIKPGETLKIDDAAKGITITNDAKLTLGEGSAIIYTPKTSNLFTVNSGASFDVSGNGTIETKEIGGEENNGNQIVAILFKGGSNNHLTIGQGVTLKGQTPLYFSSKSDGKSTVEVYGTIEGISADYAAVFAPWNLTEDHAPTVTLHNTAVVENPAGGPAISLGGYTDFTSDGALIKGGTGIGISAGKLTLKGNTRIYANGKID